MHRDTKLGLALGMLVIGFTVAFCFPRVTPSISRPAAEQVASDPALEFLPIRAYDVPVRESASNTVSPAEPAPVELVPVVGTFPGQTRPARTDAEVGTSTPLPKAPPVSGLNGTGRPESHQVQAGDTLSGIANRYLGSPQKYYEIFEANQELLATPDALKIGMILKIPGGQPGSDSGTEPQPTLAEQSSPPGELVPVPDPYSSAASQRTYQVLPGDTLEDIALRHYGTTSVIPQIRQANPMLQDPRRLRVGSTIELPVIR